MYYQENGIENVFILQNWNFYLFLFLVPTLPWKLLFYFPSRQNWQFSSLMKVELHYIYFCVYLIFE